MNPESGKVYLVGAGPGDPGLISVKGHECIKKAHVVIYDYLVSPELLKHVSSRAETIYVGKKGGDHTLSQAGINDLIVEKARMGFRVTRLKGGDPFIFGRGGEEAEILIHEGIPFEVIPGVTSAIAAPAYAGIPLTHRDHASSVTFVTGHEDPTKEKSSIDWEALARDVSTLVFLMGVKNLPTIVKRLLKNGKDPSTPVALIRWGTTPAQETVSGSLDTIVQEVEKAGLKAPAVIVVGQVVRLREKMKWFEKRPLMGKTVVVTRARPQASDLVKQLTDLGARCLEMPVIEIVPPQDMRPLDAAIDNLQRYHWLVFTSVNGVDCFFRRLSEKGYDARALANLKTASIGPATAERLRANGLASDIIPETYQAESVVEAFKKEPMQSRWVLLPRAAEARPILPSALEKMGAEVNEVIAYRTEMVRGHAATLADKLEKGKIDVVTFTSSSTVKNFLRLLPEGKPADRLAGVVLASIGPITTATARALGLAVDVTADHFTISGLCDAVVSYYQPR